MKKRIFYLQIGLLLIIGLFLPILSIQGQNETVKNAVNLSLAEQNWEEKEFEVTMYTLDECGKLPGHPAYGITTSGKKVAVDRTVAASPELPFGSEIKIPGFDTTFVVEDRGGMIKTYRGKWKGVVKIDIYTTDKEEALRWGRRKVKGEILILSKDKKVASVTLK